MPLALSISKYLMLWQYAYFSSASWSPTEESVSPFSMPWISHRFRSYFLMSLFTLM